MPPDYYGGYETQQRADNLIYEAGAQYLTNGKMKYIWYATSGKEQLFDLERDYEERHDLSRDPAYSEELSRWRSRLIAELAGRAEGYSDGKRLIPGRRPARLSPQMQKLYDQRFDEGYRIPYARPKYIPEAQNYRNML